MKKIVIFGLTVVFFLSQGYYGDFSDSSMVVGKAAAQDQVVNVPPVIEVLPDVSSGIAPLTVHFEGLAYDEDGKICGLEWDFQGDGVFDFVHDLRALEGQERAQVMKQGLQKVYTFENPGIFHVLVRATDDTETKATASVTIQVHSDRPFLDIVPSDTEFEFMAQAGYEAFFDSDISKGVKFELGDTWIVYTMKDQFGESVQGIGVPEGNFMQYNNVYTNVDVRYTVYDDLLLEEFIVQKYMPISVIEQVFEVHGVEYKMADDGSIQFYNGEDVVFSIPKPVMYEFDNPEKKCYGLHYEVIPQGEYYLLKKVIDDQDWLKKAKYPVVIDSSTQGEIADPWEQQGLTPYGQYFKNLNEYVDPLTGHLTIRHTDYTLSGRGLDVSVTRVYSTVVAYKEEEDGSGEYVPIATYKMAPTDLGCGWSLDFPWLEIDDDAPGKYFHMRNGKQVQTQFQNGMWLCDEYGFTMYVNGDNTYTKYRDNGIKEDYDSMGRVTAITDLNGNQITFSYYSWGLASITDTVGRVITFSYSGEKLISVSDGIKTISYAYSGDKLVSVTDPLGRVTSYEYLSESSFLVTGVNYPSGGFSSYEYAAVVPEFAKIAPYKSSETDDGDTDYYVYKVDSADTVTWTSPKDISGTSAVSGRPCVFQRDDGSLVMYFKDRYQWTEENCYWDQYAQEWICETVTHTEYWIKRSVSTDQQHWSTPQNVLQVKGTTGNPVVIEKQDGSFIMYYKDKYMWTEENCYWKGRCPWDCQYVCETITHTEYWIYKRTSSDGLVWGSPSKVRQTVLSVRNIAAIQKQNGNFLMCYTDKVGSSYYIRQITSTNGTSWGSPSNVVKVNSSTGNPALLQADSGIVYLAYRKESYVYVISNAGSGWLNPVQTTAVAEGDPALLQTESEIVLIYKGTDDKCYRISSANGSTWSSPSQIAPNKALTSPSTVDRKDRFYRVTAQYISESLTNLVKVTEYSYEGNNYLSRSTDVVIKDAQTLKSSMHFEYDSKGRTIERISKDEQGTQTEKIKYTYNNSNKVIRQNVYAGTSSSISYSVIAAYDNQGNTVYTKGPEGAEQYYSYANTSSENQFVDSKGSPVNLFSDQFYSNSLPSECHTLIVGKAFINNGKVTETYYKYDATGNLTETKTLFPTRDYTVFSGEFDENGQTTFEFDLTGTTITDGILVISSIAVPTQETFYETHSEVGKGWLNTGSWSGKYFMADYLKCYGMECWDGETKIGPFVHYPGTPGYTGYTKWVENNRTQYVKTSYTQIVNEYPEKTEYNLNSNGWTIITNSLGSGTTSTTVPASSFVQGLNTLQFKESNTFSTKLNWTLYIDQGVTPEDYITSYTYDDYGNKTSVTNAEDHTITFAYSADYGYAYLTSLTNDVGGTTSATYDFTTGQVLSITNPEGYTNTYEYDLLGRVTKSIHPDLSEKEIVYNDASNCITLYDELDHYTMKYFDGLGRTTTIEYYMNNQVYATEVFTHNYLNKLAAFTDPLGYTYTRQYDSKGRPVGFINPDGTLMTVQYNDNTNMVTLSDENQHITQFKFNWNNKLLQVDEFIDQTTFFSSQYEYDHNGNVIAQTDANGNTTLYEYDSLFGQTKVVHPDLTTENFVYDKAGNMVSRTDANGNTTSYSYDAISQLTQIQYADGNIISFEYDLNGNRTLMADPAGISTYIYDSRNRPITKTRTIDGIPYTVETEYNAGSFPISITYPGGNTISFVYDDLNRLISIPGYAQFTYNAKSMVENIVYGNGVQTTFLYGCYCNQPTQIHAAKNGNELLNFFYTYDAVGNVARLEKGIFNLETQVFETSFESYDYDWLDRLISATTDIGSYSYAYDAGGNRISLNETEYTYNSVNELVSMNDGTTFSYDQNGNMLGKTGTDTWVYQYNYADQLTHVQCNGQLINQYMYNGDGTRIQKTEWSEPAQEFQSTIYMYNGVDVFYEKNTDTGMNAHYIYGPAGRLAKIAGGCVYYYHTDHLGSTRLITDETGTTVTSVGYQPFGTKVNKGEPEKYLFTGKEEDASHLYYYGARYYDPELGRFLTRDPKSGELTNPQSLNRYAYCLNNPLRYIDKWGLSVSSGNGDCDCIDNEEVQEWLDKLAKTDLVIKDLEDRIKAQHRNIEEHMKPKIDACIRELHDKVVSFLDDILTYDRNDIDLRTLHSLLDVFIFVFFGVTTGSDFGIASNCLIVYSNYMAAQRDIENLEESKRKVEENRIVIIERIRERCECALPEEYALPEGVE
jgi:RHS repeat-associated protein